jgi:hypothetical protein
MNKFLIALLSLFVLGVEPAMAQQGTSISQGSVPVQCAFINGTANYTYILSSIRQSCSGGPGCIGGMVGFGYSLGSGYQASKCSGAFTQECSNVLETTTAGCSSNCTSACSGSCSGADCNCASYNLGCPDPCVTSLNCKCAGCVSSSTVDCSCSVIGCTSSDREYGRQNLVFNVPGSRVVLIYDVYVSASSAYLTTIGIEFICSNDGTTLTASIPATTGFSLSSDDSSSATSVTVDVSSTTVPEITLVYTAP